MPKSKHRRKAGGKAVAKPGRTARAQANSAAIDTKMWRALSEVVETVAQRGVSGLPLFDHAADDKPARLPSGWPKSGR